MAESTWGHAWRKTKEAQRGLPFAWGGEAVLAVAGGTWLTAVASTNATTAELVGRAVGGGLSGLATVVLAILAFHFIRAPYRQRDKARQELQECLEEPEEPFTHLVSWARHTDEGGLPIVIVKNMEPHYDGTGDLIIPTGTVGITIRISAAIPVAVREANLRPLPDDDEYRPLEGV